MTQVFSDHVPRIRALMLELQDLIDANEMTSLPNEYLGRDVLKFDMSVYCAMFNGSRQDDELITLDKARSCGTAACALGWCSMLIEPKQDMSWVIYAYRLLYNDPESLSDLVLENSYEWVFGYDWAHSYANQPKHVVRRLDWLVANGPEALLSRGMRSLWKEIENADRSSEGSSSAGTDCHTDGRESSA